MHNPRYQVGTALFFGSLVLWSYLASWYWSDKQIEKRLGKREKLDRKHLTFIVGGKE